MINQNTNRAVESILVTSGNRRLVNFVASGGALPGGGTRAGAATDIPLMSAVNTGYVNLFDGQLGVFCADGMSIRNHNVALLSTDTFVQANDIYIAQGTSTSQKPGTGAYPLINNRPYETTGTIVGRNHVICAGRLAQFASSSVWNIGETTTINISDLTEYAMHLAYRGEALDVENTAHGYEQTTYNWTTPEYSTLGLTSNLDHFIQNYAYQINRNSRAFYAGSLWGANEPVVAFAIELVGTADTDINDAAYDTGGSVPVFIKNGRTYSINLTQEQVLSLRAAIPATHGIKTINLTTAGNAANCLWITLLALDRDLVYDDRMSSVKIRLDVGLGRGFNSNVSKTEESFAFEGEGVGRHWVIFYTNSAGQRKQAQFQRQSWPFIEIASTIDANEYYNVYVLEHRSAGEIGIANISVSPKKAIILIPTCDTTTLTDFETIMNTWVKSLPSYTLMEDGEGTTALSLGAMANYCA